MYSINQNPGLAVELARAAQDDRLRRAGAARLAHGPKAPRRRLRLPRAAGWKRRPVVAV